MHPHVIVITLLANSEVANLVFLNSKHGVALSTANISALGILGAGSKIGDLFTQNNPTQWPSHGGMAHKNTPLDWAVRLSGHPVFPLGQST